MEDKESYTHKEVEEMFNAYRTYLNGVVYAVNTFSKNRINDFVKECKNKIPKSLVDKLKIKKIEI